ncbi:MAG: hypothetical protein KC646_09920 [Candidatus Cloacimonetes bacterium]|nr:hypothetical protein [Candidatus Cloacimonadota bacterium]
MKKVLASVIGGVLLSSVAFGEITITDAQVTAMQMKKVKGNWAAPGGREISSMTLKVKAWKQNKVDENDDKIIEFLKSQDSIEVSQERGLASNYASNDDYKFLKRHRSLFSNKARPKIDVVGRLLRYKKHGYVPEGDDKLVTVLRNPTYSSRKGAITVPHYETASAPVSSKVATKSKFDVLYAGEAEAEHVEGKFTLADFANTKWKNNQKYVLEFDETGENTELSYKKFIFSKKVSVTSNDVTIRENSDPQIIVGTYHFLQILDDGTCLLPTGGADYPEDCFKKK